MSFRMAHVSLYSKVFAVAASYLPKKNKNNFQVTYSLDPQMWFFYVSHLRFFLLLFSFFPFATFRETSKGICCVLRHTVQRAAPLSQSFLYTIFISIIDLLCRYEKNIFSDASFLSIKLALEAAIIENSRTL